ncbi:hypothetical protein R0J91_21565, partial [Micrococcus sp. SIMBA_131]
VDVEKYHLGHTELSGIFFPLKTLEEIIGSYPDNLIFLTVFGISAYIFSKLLNKIDPWSRGLINSHQFPKDLPFPTLFVR